MAVAVALVWISFAPASPKRAVRERLNGYLQREETIAAEDEMGKSFTARVVSPLLRRLLRFLGRLMPHRSVEATRQMLVHAGQPGGLAPMDFYGLRVLLALLLCGGYLLVFSAGQPFSIALRNALLAAFVGFFLPQFWLRRRVRQRQREIARALPDALDMMTIGVEAGLAFESAMLRVGDLWDNALTRELQHAVGEMRVGTPRDVALQRMVERTGVEELATFVAVLVQSSQLGVTIAQVLHAQAAEMRTRREQRAEELARQAGIKMLFPLLVFIFPAIMVVVLGPALPQFAQFFDELRANLPSGGIPLR